MEKLLSASVLANASRIVSQSSALTHSTKDFRKSIVFNFSYSKRDHDYASDYNFDHPDALDFNLAFEKIT